MTVGSVSHALAIGLAAVSVVVSVANRSVVGLILSSIFLVVGLISFLATPIGLGVDDRGITVRRRWGTRHLEWGSIDYISLLPGPHSVQRSLSGKMSIARRPGPLVVTVGRRRVVASSGRPSDVEIVQLAVTAERKGIAVGSALSRAAQRSETHR